MRVAHPDRPILDEGYGEEEHDAPMMDVEEEEVEDEDEEDDSDFEPSGANFDRRLSVVESRLDGFITQYNQDQAAYQRDQAAYRRDTSMMFQLQAHLHQLNFGAPPPSFFYDPYDPRAPGPSHPPP